MKLNSLLSIAILLLSITSCVSEKTPPVVKGELLPDLSGKHINAHGGAVIEKDGTYYWYGENRPDSVKGHRQLGVACYTSTDLKSWENRGIVLPVTDTPGDLLESGCIIERPKVVYCKETGKFVMWFHHELKGRGYGAAHAAVAVADNPLGPFTLLRSSRVNKGIAPLDLDTAAIGRQWPEMEWWTPQWHEAIRQGMFAVRDLEGGQMSRDMTVFVDNDGKAYHIYSSEDNLTLQIAELDSTYTDHTGRYVRIFPGGHNEAPAIFRHNGTYWLITSGCTGWQPNEARLMRADSIFGPWQQLPNPCRGEKAELTFLGQGNYVMNLDGNFIFMADIWNPKNLEDSRYLWLPIKFSENDSVPYIDSPYDND